MGKRDMHELGILCQVVRIVDETAQKNRIQRIKAVTLSVGEESGYLPVFLEKLFPVAIERVPLMKDAKLHIEIMPGRGLQVKSIGY